MAESSSAPVANGNGTALITGASAGLGEAFTRELARRGYNLILVARNRERLEALAAELAGRDCVRVEVLAADLTERSQLAQVEARLRAEPPVSLLINNAGFGIGKSFLKSDIDAEERMVLLHVVAPVRLSHAALFGMRARRHGAIINVSSMAGLVPGPRNATYGASKAYLNSFSETLQLELAGSGVHVQALCPGFTHTEFHTRAGMRKSDIPKRLWMDADAVVHESLDALGSGKVVLVPGLLNKALAATIAATPRPVLRAVAARAMRKWR